MLLGVYNKLHVRDASNAYKLELSISKEKKKGEKKGVIGIKRLGKHKMNGGSH